MVEKLIRQCLVTDNSDVTRLLIGNGADEIPVSGQQSGKAVVELNLPGRRATIGPDQDLSDSIRLQASPLRQQCQFLVVIHGFPRNKFLSEHIHSVK
jgi:hypothetical protein